MFVVHVRQQRHWIATQAEGLRVIGFVAHVQAGEPQDLSEVRINGDGALVPLPIPGHKVLHQAKAGPSGYHVYIYPVVVQKLA